MRCVSFRMLPRGANLKSLRSPAKGFRYNLNLNLTKNVTIDHRSLHIPFIEFWYNSSNHYSEGGTFGNLGVEYKCCNSTTLGKYNTKSFEKQIYFCFI